MKGGFVLNRFGLDQARQNPIDPSLPLLSLLTLVRSPAAPPPAAAVVKGGNRWGSLGFDSGEFRLDPISDTSLFFCCCCCEIVIVCATDVARSFFIWLWTSSCNRLIVRMCLFADPVDQMLPGSCPTLNWFCLMFWWFVSSSIICAELLVFIKRFWESGWLRVAYNSSCWVEWLVAIACDWFSFYCSLRIDWLLT